MTSSLIDTTEKQSSREIVDGIDVFDEIRKLCSHSMKSPISAILESCLLLSENSSPNAFQNALIRNIEDAVYSLYDMIDRTHELIRIKASLLPFSEKPVNVMNCIQNILARQNRLIEEQRVTLSVRTSVNHLIRSSNAYRIRGDEFLIYAILNHLVKLAVTGSPSGVQINIELSYKTCVCVKIFCQGSFSEEINDYLLGFHREKGDSVKHNLDLFIVRQFIRMTGTVIDIIPDSEYQTCILIQIPFLIETTKEQGNAIS